MSDKVRLRRHNVWEMLCQLTCSEVYHGFIKVACEGNLPYAPGGRAVTLGEALKPAAKHYRSTKRASLIDGTETGTVSGASPCAIARVLRHAVFMSQIAAGTAGVTWKHVVEARLRAETKMAQDAVFAGELLTESVLAEARVTGL